MRKLISVILTLIAISMAVSCSTKKNTALTRRVHAFKARYNTYYNGTLAFIDGQLAQEKGNKDNCTDFIPYYMTGNKATEKLGSSNYKTAIEKCQKTIKKHSIVARPKWTSNRPKTEKDKIWLSQKEYNPFLWRAWFLMGESQFRQGEYIEAASTFAYMQRLYFHKPDIVAKAKILEAKCYAEMGWNYEAEDIIARAKKDSFPNNLENLRAGVMADIQIRQQMYEDAIPNIEKGVKAAHRNLEKARLYFLLGQLCHKVGQEEKAYKYFTKVIRRNPPYELEFNARIQRTETMSKSNWRSVIKKLKSMARNPKNKDYLDQVYYAIGNVYLAHEDTVRAIWAYNDGKEKSTRSGVEKGVLLVKLGSLYYEQEEFVKAQECYSAAVGMLDKDREDYKDIDERAKVLEELKPFATAVELQDSLQELAAMDSVERMEVIYKIIDDLKKKEKEEAKKAAAAAQQANQANQTQNNMNMMNTNRPGEEPAWYFYNSSSVSSGKTEFQRKWGERPNEHHWNRKNKTILEDYNDEDADSLLMDSLQTDSLMGDSLMLDSLGNVIPRDSLNQLTDSTKMGGLSNDDELSAEEKLRQERATDPHHPEFYLKDIPFTEEQMAESNKKLSEGLFGSAIIFKDRMENLPLADRTFRRVMDDFPEFDKKEEMYYNLFQLYSRMNMPDSAEVYRLKMIDEYPENEHVSFLSDPNFIYKALYGKATEDSLYAEAWDSYQASEYQKVIDGDEYAKKEYPSGDNRARFMFISAMSKLELGERSGFMNSLKEIVEKYPKSSVSELAGIYVKGLKDGKLLASGRFESGSIWERRRGMLDGDSLAADTTFSDEKNCDWLFAIAYERDSVDVNQMLFEMARYNFTNFTVRNFDISFDKGDGIDMLQIRQFANYDEAYIYLHRLMNDEDMAYKLDGLKCFIISEDNLKKLFKGLSFADYFDFYDHTFDKVGHLQIDENLLDEPTELPERVEEEEEEEEPVDDYLF